MSTEQDAQQSASARARDAGAGFVLDGLEEPADAAGPRPERPFSWANFPGIPVALVARMRLVR